MPCGPNEDWEGATLTSGHFLVLLFTIDLPSHSRSRQPPYHQYLLCWRVITSYLGISQNDGWCQGLCTQDPHMLGVQEIPSQLELLSVHRLNLAGL